MNNIINFARILVIMAVIIAVSLVMVFIAGLNHENIKTEIPKRMESCRAQGGDIQYDWQMQFTGCIVRNK